MKTSTIIKLIAWFILMLIGIDYSLEMISSSSTVELSVGLVLLSLIWAVSIKTKGFTDINFKKKKKDESND